MRSRRLSFVIALAMSAAGIVFSSSASAQQPGAPPAPPPAVDKPQSGTEPLKESETQDHKRIGLYLNPLAISIGRYSIQGEYLPALHHAITLNPFFAHVPVKVTVNGQEGDLGSLNGFGGELGYRYYTGTKGPNGFFVGPSVLFASYSQSRPSGTSAPAGESDSFLNYGAALDIGGQAVLGPGIVIGGGFGLQWTKTSKDINTDNLNLASSIIAGGGVRPRFLLSFGYAF